MLRAARTATPVAIRKEFIEIISKLPSDESIHDDYALQDLTDDEWDEDEKMSTQRAVVEYADASVQADSACMEKEGGG